MKKTKLKLKKNSKILLLIIFILLIVFVFNFNKKDNDLKMETKIKINNSEYKIVLEDNKTVKELLNILPLNITMHDLNNNEKYYYLEEPLISNPTNVTEIKKGDIMLYGNNCLVIFYDNFTTYYKYTKIGHVDIPKIENILGNDDVIVNIYEGKK